MERVLVIGEARVLTLALQEGLAGRGCAIESAAGGVDALHRLRHRSFDVVLTDPKTPVGEDLALVKEMRRVRPGLRTVLLASAATPDEVLDAMRQHVFSCFTHPIDPADVVSMVVKAFEATEWHEGIEVLSARRDWICV